MGVDWLEFGALILVETPMRNPETAKRSFTEIEIVMGEELEILEILAFNGLYNIAVEFLPEHRDALYRNFPSWNDSMLDGLSFLRTSDSSAIYYFMHLIFQEYFAASYFVQCWIDETPLDLIPLGTETQSLEPEEFLGHEKYNGLYNVMWRIISGLLSMSRKLGSDRNALLGFFWALESEPRDLLGLAHLRLLMHCFNEVDCILDQNSNRGVKRTFKAYRRSSLSLKMCSCTRASIGHCPGGLFL
jgi:hypothetical protein